MIIIDGVKKLKVLDASPLKEGIQTTISAIETTHSDISSAQRAVRGLTSLEESLKGEMGSSVRAFYENCHQPFLIYMHQVLTDYKQTLQNVREAVHSFDPVDTAYVKEEFLSNDVIRDLDKIENETEDLSTEANSIMSSVTDIVALTRLDTDSLREAVDQGNRKSRTTIEELNELDSSQTALLDSVYQDFQTMETYLSEIAGKIDKGAMSVSSFKVDAISGIPEHQKIMESVLPEANESEDAFIKKGEDSLQDNYTAGFDSTVLYKNWGARVNRGADAYALSEMGYKVYKGAKIEKRVIGSAKSGNFNRYTIRNPEVLELGKQKKSGRTTKIFDQSYINKNKNLPVNQYIKSGTGAIAGMKSKAGWLGVVAGSVANGVYDYIYKDAPLSKVAGDVGVDVGFGAVSLAVGGAVSALAVGSFGLPLLGGAAIAVGASLVFSSLIDGIKFGKGKNKKSVSEHVKSGVQSIGGWFKKKLSF